MGIETIADAWDKFRELHADYVLVLGNYAENPEVPIVASDAKKLREVVDGLHMLLLSSSLKASSHRDEIIGSIYNLSGNILNYADRRGFPRLWP